MAKIWVDIQSSVSPDGDETKKALTKAAKKKIEDGMVASTAAALSAPFSNKASDKPKDKRDDHAARAVRIEEALKIKVATKGPKLSIDGKLIVTVSTLALKSENEKGEHVGEYKREVKELEKRGTIEKQFDALVDDLLKELDVGAFSVKPLSGSAFQTAAKQRNLPV